MERLLELIMDGAIRPQSLTSRHRCMMLRKWDWTVETIITPQCWRLIYHCQWATEPHRIHFIVGTGHMWAHTSMSTFTQNCPHHSSGRQVALLWQRDRATRLSVEILQLQNIPIVWHYLRDPTFSRFYTIPECDRHTHRDGRTDTRRRHTLR